MREVSEMGGPGPHGVMHPVSELSRHVCETGRGVPTLTHRTQRNRPLLNVDLPRRFPGRCVRASFHGAPQSTGTEDYVIGFPVQFLVCFDPASGQTWGPLTWGLNVVSFPPSSSGRGGPRSSFLGKNGASSSAYPQAQTRRHEKKRQRQK